MPAPSATGGKAAWSARTHPSGHQPRTFPGTRFGVINAAPPWNEPDDGIIDAIDRSRARRCLARSGPSKDRDSEVRKAQVEGLSIPKNGGGSIRRGGQWPVEERMPPRDDARDGPGFLGIGPQRTSRSSTSKRSVALGGITPPAPLSP